MTQPLGSEEEFRSTIAEYLESLPTQFTRRVFSNPAACLAIFRLLSTVGKQLILSMLYLDTPLALAQLHQWARPTHQRTVKAKIHQLRKLQILTEDQGIALNPIFREQLRNALTGGGDFSAFGIPSGQPRVTVQWLKRYADEKWEAILHYMVGRSHDITVSESVLGILRTSRLMEDNGGMTITNSGFQFLLQDAVAQVWTVLLQYLRLAEMHEMDVVEVLNFLFQLISLQLGQPYSVEALTGNQRRMLSELCDFGLLYQSTGRFYPTHLITSLTSGSHDTESTKLSDQGFIILETNGRLYAYTSSPLQIAILNLFVDMVNRFPNFITGMVTRESVRRALTHGITAEQIVTFLTTHAHPQMHARVPILPITVTDQIRLWERERNRLKPTQAHFYKDFAAKQDFERVFRYAQDIGVILWANIEKRQLVVSRQGHPKIVEMIRKK
ncbi:RNA polymerase II transcription factor B 52 kDa subunit [Coemansia spiralis]|uniref:RNA polymerase II transcription factor B subunit 2 n=2 Tax=Coemansia TaxID=4863 RepID=A0A9W8G4Z2_9FUNG|nr:RNA polymerase II transcription factor B 52 kDa subunit [Coemansia umbellata]KAJ2622688.1 RNA polymerase II transcription factor B 52 kDa subunit [Coemansia sp. RSA 1358]KAJ2679099.1 RNA polymerase II transcription factor B 52 kDa subunit [Coemansia spiralis]